MATEQAGPSYVAAGAAQHGGVPSDFDSNASAAEKRSLAAVRDFLALERAQLERERRLKEQSEQMDADLARQLHEQEMQGSEPMDTSEPARSCQGDINAQHSNQAYAPDHASSQIPPSPSYLPATPVNAASSSSGAPVLPDSIPVIIASSPGSPQFHCHSISPGYPQYHQFPRAVSPGSPIVLPDSPSPAISPLAGHSAPPGPSTSTAGGCSDVSDFQRKIEADARAKAQREAEDERLAKLLQAEEAQRGEALVGHQSDLDAEMAAKIMAELQQADQERANRDAQLAAEAWVAEQRLAEEAKQREQEGLEAAQRAQKEEERQAREQQAQRQAQAAEDEHVAQLLDAVSKATRQDVTDLDRAAVIADSAAGPTFECPLLFIECDKEEEGACVGQWSCRMCNHWVSTGALVQYICQEAEEQRFRMRCPVCAATRCDRCALHGVNHGGCCYIPPRQIRLLLSEDQMARLLFLQEQWYRTANKDKIVQCPHPDCQFFYALEAEDIGGGGGGGEDGGGEDGDDAVQEAAGEEDGDAGEGGGKVARWQEGRDMWCDTCEMRYCLHCGDAMGTLVRWHAGRTCAQFLQDADNAKAAAERKRLEKVANEGHEQNRGKTWQRCPRCGYEAWKAEGQCNRVVCKEHCGANFCFLCGEDITRPRYQHYEATGPCHLKVWHQPLADTAGGPPCRCAGCRKA